MIKKTLLILSLLLTVFAGTIGAQQISGRWTIYPVIGTDYKQVIETNDKVFILQGSTLSHYDLKDNDHYVYSQLNRLSENGPISAIYYNNTGKYLLVAYETGNIDLLYDNGNTVNMPEIRDAILSQSRKINNVIFDDNKIYVATSFGFVIFDDKKHEVIESGVLSGIPDTGVTTAAHICGSLIIHIPLYDMYYASDDIRRPTLANFTKLSPLYSYQPFIQVGNRLVYEATTPYLYYRTYTAPDKHQAGGLINGDLVGHAIPTTTGLCAATKTKYYTFDSDLTGTSVDIPSSLANGKLMYMTSPKSVWVVLNGELGRYDLSSDTPTKLMTIAAPVGTKTQEPVFFRWANDGRLYFTQATATQIYSVPEDGFFMPSYIETFDNGEISDATLYDATNFKNKVPQKIMEGDIVCSNTGFDVDTDDPDLLFVSNNVSGLYAIKNNKLVTFSHRMINPTPDDTYMNRTMGVAVDPEGNVWMGIGYNDEDGQPCLGVLPASKKLRMHECKASDWVTIPHEMVFRPGVGVYRDPRFTFCKKSDMLFLIAGNQECGFCAYGHNGTYTNIKDDKSAHYTSVVDTEGNTIELIFIYCIVEDKNGAVWAGTSRGVFYLSNPLDALNSTTMRVKRPIVPRNDGTNFGDYLLESERIYSIAVDSSNRKWLGTYSSGVYLVSEDGTKILAHYTTENSPLPSNAVFAVTCDPNGNRVFFGTPNGMATFESDSAPAAASFDDVYAYPNPVRPDYTGWITITGLMEGSQVKIADVAGNVFFTGKSNGGMVSWDGCDAAGNRVKTGVYLVFASEGTTGGSSGVVTKIMVVN